MRASDIATGAPGWVWLLLIVLIVLGIRRLRTREVPAAVALLPLVGFGSWSLVSLWPFAAAGLAVALGSWLGGALLGTLSALAVPEPRGERLPHRRIRLPGPACRSSSISACSPSASSAVLGRPSTRRKRTAATAIGVGVGAAMFARLAIAVARWR